MNILEFIEREGWYKVDYEIIPEQGEMEEYLNVDPNEMISRAVDLSGAELWNYNGLKAYFHTRTRVMSVGNGDGENSNIAVIIRIKKSNE
ncbi:hypothetical protein QJ48_03990 [Paenibacillus sp. A3]|uniref:hypothetical protein n=1 Tax=Paenibacillus sp. A3 TaxID=1337054 RepID=UPI0006D59E4B|nr:hypothetical protein [Paenibacillus sp. A3]KPV60705.1 hypothetical protein QJ48_03990 [Paenibacillus sp. A3]